MLTQEVLTYIEDHATEAKQLLMELAQIPAPSHHEEKRAVFCKVWLEANGAQGVYIDDALNVVYPVNCSNGGPIVVVMAHTDVVFPDTEPLPLIVEDGKICCPGVGDDTANLVALLMAAKYVATRGITPRGCGMLFVANSCEEGLGDLKGSKKIMQTYGNRIREFISFDGYSHGVVNKAVGSKRYNVTIETEGGHSYGRFGNRNAIACMASLIDFLYSLKVPERGKTTYNVGVISGGTSVNTIAQNAAMQYEFRSDDRLDLEEMEKHFDAAIAYYRTKGITVNVELIGDRPCMGEVDRERHGAMVERARAAIAEHFGFEAGTHSASTDCNIPLSQGVPAICLGCCIGDGAHTREEYVLEDSLVPGFKLCLDMVLGYYM